MRKISVLLVLMACSSALRADVDSVWRAAVVGLRVDELWSCGVQELAKESRSLSTKVPEAVSEYAQKYHQAIRENRRLAVFLGVPIGTVDVGDALTCTVADTPGQRHLWGVQGPMVIIGVPRDGELWIERHIQPPTHGLPGGVLGYPAGPGQC